MDNKIARNGITMDGTKAGTLFDGSKEKKAVVCVGVAMSSFVSKEERGSVVCIDGIFKLMFALSSDTSLEGEIYAAFCSESTMSTSASSLLSQSVNNLCDEGCIK